MPTFILSSKIKTTLLFVVILISIYAIIGFSILPAVLSNKIPSLVQEQLQRNASVKQVKFNPFSIELSIDGLQIDELDSNAFVKFDRFYLNLAVLDSISTQSLKIDQLSLQTPYISVIRDKKANFNFSDLIPEEEQKKKDNKESSDDLFPVTIGQLSISEGKISWTDNIKSQGQQEDIYPLNLDIKNFTTIVDKQSNLGFSLKFASGGYFDWLGKIKLNPLESKGHIKLNNLDLHRVWELFLKDSVAFNILKGSELIKADYQFTSTRHSTQLLINNADVSLIDFQLVEKGLKDSLINIPSFTISGIAVDLLQQSIEINKVSSKNSHFKAWLNSDGSINYQSLFSTNTDPKATNNTPIPADNSKSKPWNVLVKQFELNNFTFNFIDKTFSPAVPTNLSSINISSTQLSTKKGVALPFNLAFDFNNTGHLAAQGSAVLEPLESNLKLDISNIPLKDFQHYASQFAKLDIISGLFNLNLDIALQQIKEQPLAITLTGNSHIDKFSTRDQISNKDFVKWKKLSINNIDIDVAKNKYVIDAIKIDRPYARVIIKKDKTTNISDIVIDNSKAEKPHSDEKPTEKTSPVNFKIKHFVMTDGISDFSDKSLILPFSAHINHLKGSVNGISSEKDANIKINLDGRIANYAPVTIKGKVLPSKGDSDFKVAFNSMPLPLITPYMVEFSGRKIEKGNVTLKFEYKIRDNQLNASNSLFIDQLLLGEEVESPNAVSLPLDLAIALLQDNEGKIALSVPIVGDLDNPEFSVAGIIFDSLANVLTKIISSPFNAIASLFSSDKDISKVTFSAGRAELDAEQLKKLDELSNALSKRPALKLEIEGTAFSAKDWPQMQAVALDKQILELRINELTQEKSKKELPKKLAHKDENYQRLLANLFIQQFPNLAEKSLFGTPRLIAPQSGNFYTVAQEKLAALIPPDNYALQYLAASRAKAIATYLVNNKIEIDRVFLLGVKVDEENPENLIASNLNLIVD